MDKSNSPGYEEKPTDLRLKVFERIIEGRRNHFQHNQFTWDGDGYFNEDPFKTLGNQITPLDNLCFQIVNLIK